ncbi:MAG: carboxypeptidase-like regulatory domain-containing protein [Acidobacteriota bacterium]
MKVVFIILILLAGCDLSRAQSYDCTPLASDDSAQSGANEEVDIIKQRSALGVRGVVSDVNGLPIEGSYVEIFPSTKAHWLGKEMSRSEPSKRAAGCVTATGGRFYFPVLDRGYYEIRISKKGGWNHTHIYIKLSSDFNRKKTIKVDLTPGT